MSAEAAIDKGGDESKALALALGGLLAGHQTAVAMTALDFVMLAIWKTSFAETMDMRTFAKTFSDSLVLTEQLYRAHEAGR